MPRRRRLGMASRRPRLSHSKCNTRKSANGLYLPDFRVRMPDGRIYSIAGIRRQGEPDDFLRRLFDEVEPVWELHDSDLPDDADVQIVTLGTYLKDLLFRYKRENITMSAMSGFRLHFYLGDELIHEVAGLTVDELLAYAMKLRAREQLDRGDPHDRQDHRHRH